MALSIFINHFNSVIQKPLPGHLAQYKMAHVFRKQPTKVALNHKVAAVLILVYPVNNVLHTILIKRQFHPKDKHKGQISFPGGQVEEHDISIVDTALREAYEEVGLQLDKTNVLGQLTDLYIPVSNFLVTPIVAYYSERPVFSPQESEVSLILEAPIADFNHNDPLKMDMTVGKDIRLKDVPYFDVNGHIVWGATAMIMSEFQELIS